MDVTFAQLEERARERFAVNSSSSPSSVVKDPSSSSMLSPRSQILRLSCLVGKMSGSFLEYAPMDKSRAVLTELEDESEDEGQQQAILFHPPAETQQCMGDVLMGLFLTSHSCCSLNLYTCIKKKMLLNERKYPVELCKGKSGKYTKYSSKTGITKETGQSTLHDDDGDHDTTKTVSIHQVQLLIRKFATDRLWARYHTPRNLVLALLGELGELAELFQWRGDDENTTVQLSLSTEELDHIGQELADVAIYLLRLADICGVDIGAVAAASTI